jgi:hypothetical protein
MTNNNSNDVCDYSDADWAGSYDRKLTTDFCIFVGEKRSYMEEQEIKCCGSVKHQSGISSHDIYRE